MLKKNIINDIINEESRRYMKNKNGFTLVELLAVVILLSVISLIVVPQVMKLVNDIKKGAAEDSVYGYINVDTSIHPVAFAITA